MLCASEAEVWRLYHYQRYSLGRLTSVIEERKIYLSRPGGFNDPWDCRPCYDTAALSDAAYRDRVIEFYFASHRKLFHWPEEKYAAVAAELMRDQSKLKWLIERMSSIDVDIDRRYRIYCLTSRPDNPLMWAHYAQSHAGLCLEFSAETPIMGDALQIQYRDSYPRFNVAEDGDDVLLSLTTKSVDWSYEAEYRFIAQERKEAQAARTHFTDNSFLSLPNGVLKAVIVGCLMPQADRDQVRALIARNGTGIALKEAVRIPNKYKLELKPFEP